MTPVLALAWLLAIAPAADPEAAYLESRALLAAGGEAGVDRAIDRAQEAVATSPDVARYQHQLGTACARKAMTGTFAAVRYAGRIERAFERAVALEPRWIEARQSLLGFRLIAPRLLGGSIDAAEAQARAITQLDPLLGAMAFMAVHHARGAWASLERDALAAAPMAVAPAHRRQLLALLSAAGYPVVDDGAFGPLWLVALPARRGTETSVADAFKASEAAYRTALALSGPAASSPAPTTVAATEPPAAAKPPQKAKVRGKRRAQARPAGEG
ncbi:MAG: hypothetical protein QM704_25180 [Anaeromyxobacteraceae bacterium]